MASRLGTVGTMEAFEQFVALALESEGFVVSGALKFPVRRLTRKTAYPEYQTHGYEVDLVAARSDRLILATVKSFFGSRGVAAAHVRGDSGDSRGNALYAMLNASDVREAVITAACERFGFTSDQVELRLYVGKFASRANELQVREWCQNTIAGSGPITVIGAPAVVDAVRTVASSKQYRDDAVLATIKVLEAAGALPKLS